MHRDEVNSKSGSKMRDVLDSKHPTLVVPTVDNLEKYSTMIELVILDITTDTVEKVFRKMSGSVGLGGVYAAAISHWMLRFGKASGRLREAVEVLCR